MLKIFNNIFFIKKPLINILTLLILSTWIILLPILYFFPIYVDEIYWKLINSRFFLDRKEMMYFFPVCTKGFLLNTPISWYPARILDSLIYQDLSNIYKLRYISLTIFLFIILYLAWFVRKIKITNLPFLNSVGIVLAPFSFGVLPFMLVMNRPEQLMVLLIILACTLPIIINKKIKFIISCVFAIFYLIISWIILGTHFKSSFFLPSILLSAFFLIKNWKL